MILSLRFNLDSQRWCCSAQLHNYTVRSFLRVAKVRNCKVDWTEQLTGRKRRTDVSLHSDVLLITDNNCTFWQPSLSGAFAVTCVSGSVSVGVSGSMQSGTCFQPAGCHRCCLCFITNGWRQRACCADSSTSLTSCPLTLDTRALRLLYRQHHRGRVHSESD